MGERVKIYSRTVGGRVWHDVPWDKMDGGHKFLSDKAWCGQVRSVFDSVVSKIPQGDKLCKSCRSHRQSNKRGGEKW